MSSEDHSLRIEENLDIGDSARFRLIRSPETYRRLAEGHGFRPEILEKVVRLGEVLAGISQEEDALRRMKLWATPFGGNVHHCGKDNKPGDVMVDFDAGGTVGMDFRILVEAKDDAVARSRKPLQEAVTKAMNHREADAEIFVGKNATAFAAEIGDWAEGTADGRQWVACTIDHLHIALRYLLVMKRFRDRASMWAATNGADAMRAFLAAGGEFTDQRDEDGMTAGMYAAIRGAEAIDAFAAAGGRFTDQRENHRGRTAAMWAAANGPEAIRAFAAAGGSFSDQQDNRGYTAATFAAENGVQATSAFEEALAAQRSEQAPAIRKIRCLGSIDQLLAEAKETQRKLAWHRTVIPSLN